LFLSVACLGNAAREAVYKSRVLANAFDVNGVALAPIVVVAGLSAFGKLVKEVLRSAEGAEGSEDAQCGETHRLVQFTE
jgi:hypothetical protein